jgi:hypothetical protein
MLGWAFGLLGEVITGRGFLSQLGYEVRGLGMLAWHAIRMIWSL